MAKYLLAEAQVVLDPLELQSLERKTLMFSPYFTIAIAVIMLAILVLMVIGR
jgi:hypothetical protein